MTDYISRSDAMVAVCKWCEHPYCEAKEKCGQWIAMTILPSADATDVYKAHEEEHLNIINRIKELQYAIAKTQTIVGKLVESADAVQGEWVCKEREYNDCDGHYAYYWYECSVCGARPPKDTWKNEWHSDFCPSCVARMKGGAE